MPYCSVRTCPERPLATLATLARKAAGNAAQTGFSLASLWGHAKVRPSASCFLNVRTVVATRCRRLLPTRPRRCPGPWRPRPLGCWKALLWSPRNGAGVFGNGAPLDALGARKQKERAREIADCKIMGKGRTIGPTGRAGASRGPEGQGPP